MRARGSISRSGGIGLNSSLSVRTLRVGAGQRWARACRTTLARPVAGGAKSRRCRISLSARKSSSATEALVVETGSRKSSREYATRMESRIWSASWIWCGVASGERLKSRTLCSEILRRVWRCGVRGCGVRGCVSLKRISLGDYSSMSSALSSMLRW